MTDHAIVIQQDKFIAPVAELDTLLRRYQAVKDFIDRVLKVDVDYGITPGTDKPALLKPGAEKMCTLFSFHPVPLLRDKVEDWTGKDHGGEPFFYYRYAYQLWRDGILIAEGEGSCNSWEKKYRYRQEERKCPKCGKATIIPGKKEYGGGWLCFSKKGGCGAKFEIDDPAITSQHVGQIKNPDPADLVNTIQKMAQKRALVAPVLIATNTSDYFTQDTDDFIEGNVVDQPTNPTQEYLDQLRKIEHEKPIIPSNGKMTLEEAMKVTDSKGHLYTNITDAGLKVIRKNILAKINDEDIETQSRHQTALEAIDILLANPSRNQPVAA